MALDLGPNNRLRMEVSELPRRRFKFELSAVVHVGHGRPKVKALDSQTYATESDFWRGLGDFAADKQADLAIEAAEARGLGGTRGRR